MSASLLSFLQAFGTIRPGDQAKLLAAWEPRVLSAGEWLVREKQVAREVFFVQQGVLRIASSRPNGQDVTHYFQRQNQCCTLLPSYVQQVPATAGIQAACATRVLASTHTRLTALCQELPYLLPIFEHVQRHELVEKVRLRSQYQGYNARARYLAFLQWQPEVARQVPLALIASYLGITPQSLSRLRKTN